MVECVCRGMIPDCVCCRGEGEVCDLCRGTRQVAGEVAEHIYTCEPCPRCAAQQRKPKARVTGLTQAMLTWTFSNMIQTYPVLVDMASAANVMLKEGYGWIVAYGPPGRGKTYTQAAVLNELYEQGRGSGRYVTMDFLLQDLQDAQLGKHSRGKSYNVLMQEFINVGVLCIDEFGEWNPTEWRATVLRHLLVSRSDSGGWKPTFLATNKTDIELLARFPWLVSRFNHPAVKEFDVRSVPDLRGIIGDES